MMWPLLGSVFMFSVLLSIFLLALWLFKPSFWIQQKRRFQFAAVIWFFPYFVFILFFTGPKADTVYPPQSTSPYKLPWAAGVSRFIAQGNRSFTSHRELHEYAWDFVMPVGTPILAARAGVVREAQDHDDGIGISPNNFVIIEHEDGQKSGYFHLAKGRLQVEVGDNVKQGQPIALSGMVGQTWFPHLHFLVFNQDKSASLPISFADVPGGVPQAGRFYTSQNQGL